MAMHADTEPCGTNTAVLFVVFWLRGFVPVMTGV